MRHVGLIAQVWMWEMGAEEGIVSRERDGSTWRVLGLIRWEPCELGGMQTEGL